MATADTPRGGGMHTGNVGRIADAAGGWLKRRIWSDQLYGFAVTDLNTRRTAPPLVTPHGWPEELFGVGPVVAGVRSGSATMTVGPWLCDGADVPAAGAFAVLMDDVVGQACLPLLPDGSWAVTTELSLQFPNPPPRAGTVTARSWTVGADSAGGTAQGEVLAADGSVVVTGSLWVNVAPMLPWPDEPPPAVGPVRSGGLTDLLDVTPEADGGLVVEPSRWLHNEQGAVHGGVVACLGEMCARHAAGAADAGPRRTASLHVVYLRRATGVLRFEPDVVHRGRSVASVRVRVVTADGRTAAEVNHLSRAVPEV